jgi:hypothetical protein
MPNFTGVYIGTESYTLGEDVPDVLIVDAETVHVWLNGKHLVETEPPEQLAEGDYIFNPGAESGVATLHRLKDIDAGTDEQAEAEIYYEVDVRNPSSPPKDTENPDTDMLNIDWETEAANSGWTTVLEEVE